MRTAVLFSGGKDSTFACDQLLREGFEISCLITIFSENRESFMLHVAGIEMVALCAQAMKIPIFIGRTSGRKDEELRDIEETVRKAKMSYDFEFLASGGIASLYQKERFEKISRDLKLESKSPLWGLNQKEYLRTLVKCGYLFVVTSVSAAGLDERWLGREINANDIDEIIRLSSKFDFNPAFEGGEAETLVLDCRLFRHYKIRIVASEKMWNGYFGTLNINRAELIPKNS